MGYLFVRTRLRAPATAERAKSLALACRCRLGPHTSSPTKPPDSLAALPRVMAAQALAFRSPAEPWPLSCATLLHVARSSLQAALAAPMPLRGWKGFDRITRRRPGRGSGFTAFWTFRDPTLLAACLRDCHNQRAHQPP